MKNKTFRFKKGFVPILLIIIVLAVSSAIVLYVVRNQHKAKAATDTIGLSVSVSAVDLTVEKGKSVNAFDVTSTGANGVQIFGYPTSYGPGINWSLSSGGMTVGQTYTVQVQVNDSVPTGTYSGTAVIKNTTTPDVINFPVTVKVIDPMTCSFSPSSAFLNENIDIKSIGASGPIILWAGPLTSTSFNVGNVIPPSGFARVVVPLTVPFILPPTAPSPPASTLGYYTVGNTKCDGLLTIKSNAFSLKFSATSINLTMAVGGKGLKAFDLTTSSATNFDFLPATNSLGIRFSPQADYINPGNTVPIYLYADIVQVPGVYTGSVYVSSNNMQGPTGIPVSVTIDPGASDSDKDGFTNDLENKIGTDPNYSCGVNNWPPDFNNDKSADILDLQILSKHQASLGAANYDKRYDLNMDGKVNSTDLLIESKLQGKTCT